MRPGGGSQSGLRKFRPGTVGGRAAGEVHGFEDRVECGRGVLGQARACDETVRSQEDDGGGPVVEPFLEPAGVVTQDQDPGVGGPFGPFTLVLRHDRDEPGPECLEFPEFGLRQQIRGVVAPHEDRPPVADDVVEQCVRGVPGGDAGLRELDADRRGPVVGGDDRDEPAREFRGGPAGFLGRRVGEDSAGVAVSFLFVLTPGADWAYAIAAGLRHRTVLPAIGGMLSGHLLMTAIVAAGVAALVARTPALMTVLTTAGAVYLLWLGAKMLTQPAQSVQAAQDPVPTSPAREALAGLGVSGLNPKVLLLFVALLPQFTDANSGWPLPMQILMLGLVHTIGCAVVYTGVGTGARVVLRARPAAARVVSTVSGIVMVALGVVLLVERLVA